MRNDTLGFSMMEVLIVMVIGIALSSVAISAFAPAQQFFAVSSARETFAAMHARTRAHAIEGGENAVLNVNFGTDVAWITRGDLTLETVDFGEALNVDLKSASPTMELCMNPRGFGETSCTSISSGTDILFVLNDERKRMRIFPLGQVLLP